MSTEAQKKLFRKYKITARKYMGDDAYSWAVFRNGRPVVTGISRDQVDYNKIVVLNCLQVVAQ